MQTGCLMASILVMGSFTVGCTTTSDESTAENPVVSSAAAATPTHLQSSRVVATCQPYSRRGGPPSFLKSDHFVITHLTKTCRTPDGREGYERNSPWMAMGIPCSGGGGHIDWKGNYQDPKMVSLMLATDCPLAPSQDEAKQLANKNFGLDTSALFAAYTPFVPQYWELPDYSDADTGFVVELRTHPSLREGWRKLLQHEPLRVNLYGRENAWVQGDHIYQVKADIILTEKRVFKVNVVDIKPLATQEVKMVKGRCEALQPRRNCLEVFEISILRSLDHFRRFAG